MPLMTLKNLNFRTMAIDNLKKKLDALLVEDTSGWRDRTAYRRKNSEMLDRSMEIALRVRSVLRQRNKTQADLAVMMGVSDQQVSKLLKGGENFTDATVRKLEAALDIRLLEVPPSSFATTDTEQVWFKHILGLLFRKSIMEMQYIPITSLESVPEDVMERCGSLRAPPAFTMTGYCPMYIAHQATHSAKPWQTILSPPASLSRFSA